MIEPRNDEYEKLFCKRTSLIKPGLARMQVALKHLPLMTGKGGNILIGGTNGKGSTASYLWLLLTQNGFNTGLFTSPHLVRFSERFVTNSEARDEDIQAAWQYIEKHLPANTYDHLSFFEVATLIAMVLFNQAQTAYNVFEVGLGGRLDAVNVVEPLISIIVSIGFDHQEYLGHSIREITREKLGISRPHKPLFIGQMAHQEALEEIEQRARDQSSPLFRLGHEILNRGEYGSIRLPDTPPVDISWPTFLHESPDYLKNNFLLAAAANHWLENHVQNDRERLEVAHRNQVPLPPTIVGRFQYASFKSGRHRLNTLLDVCHNVEAATQLRAEITKKYGKTAKLRGMVCILADKDVDAILDIFKSFLQPLVLFKIDSDRCFSANHLAPRHQDLTITESIELGILEVCEAKTHDHSPLVICGSVLAVGKVLDYFSCEPKQMAATISRIGYSPACITP